MLVLNLIYLRRANKFYIDSSPVASNTAGLAVAATIDVHMRAYGYMLSVEAIEAIARATLADALRTFTVMTTSAQYARGVKNYTPMYPNFPSQVMNASDAELYLNAIIHYFTFGRVLPDYAKGVRPPLDVVQPPTLIELSNYDEFCKMMIGLSQSSQAWSVEDREDIFNYYLNEQLSIAAIPNRENKAWLNAEIYNSFGTESLLSVSTATDVLRLAAALCGGDASLANPTRFVFPRKTRRALLSLLESVNVHDVARHQERWKRLAVALRPEDYKNRYPKAFRVLGTAFDDLKSFNRLVEHHIANKDVTAALEVLKENPGELIRRLWKICKISGPGDINNIIDAIAQVGEHASTAVLMQAFNRFNNYNGYLVTIPRGSFKKAIVRENDASEVPDIVRLLMMLELRLAINSKLSKMPPLGDVYVDPGMTNYKIMFGNRDASRAMQTYGRGTRLKMDGNILRSFIYWKNCSDVDLSVVCLSDNFDNIGNIWYGDLRTKFGTHSGDIVNGMDGASEFVDIDIAAARANGVRYLVINVHSFSGINFSNLEECFVGFMNREDANSGEIFDARTVVNKITLSGDCVSYVPAILDIETMEFIWVDLPMTFESAYRNVISDAQNNLSLIQAMVNYRPPSLWDLFSMHAHARGNLVASPEQADVIFGHGDNPEALKIRPEDSEKILSELMP